MKWRFSLRYGGDLKPARDWDILLAVSILLLIGSIIWNLEMFRGVVQGDVLGASTIKNTSGTTQATFDSIQKVFTDRAAEEAKFEDGTYHFIDPSK